MSLLCTPSFLKDPKTPLKMCELMRCFAVILAAQGANVNTGSNNLQTCNMGTHGCYVVRRDLAALS